MMASLKAAPESAKLDIIVGIATIGVPRFELTRLTRLTRLTWSPKVCATNHDAWKCILWAGIRQEEDFISPEA
jgi:hypothetical protein